MSDNSESKLFAAIAYIFSIVGIIISYLVKKDDKYVRFHVFQSLLLIIAFIIIWIVLGMFLSILSVIGLGILTAIFGILIGTLVPLGMFILILFLTYKAFIGEKYMLPVIGEHASKMA